MAECEYCTSPCNTSKIEGERERKREKEREREREREGEGESEERKIKRRGKTAHSVTSQGLMCVCSSSSPSRTLARWFSSLSPSSLLFLSLSPFLSAFLTPCVILYIQNTHLYSTVYMCLPSHPPYFLFLRPRCSITQPSSFLFSFCLTLLFLFSLSHSLTLFLLLSLSLSLSLYSLFSLTAYVAFIYTSITEAESGWGKKVRVDEKNRMKRGGVGSQEKR